MFVHVMIEFYDRFAWFIWNYFMIYLEFIHGKENVKIIIFPGIFGWGHNYKNLFIYNLCIFGVPYWKNYIYMFIKKPEIVLNNSLFSFRICKQNFKIRSFWFKSNQCSKKTCVLEKIFMTYLCSMHVKEYVCQISCKNNHFSRDRLPYLADTNNRVTVEVYCALF